MKIIPAHSTKPSYNLKASVPHDF
uniref:Uncharacterized protein n=1 Tax=Anguilla anguilla TaxID=7936 RepID=A0A0E9S461_ANGAN